MESKKEISAEFPFESKYIEVNGSKMHYIDEGKGDPILFLHGNPTSSYLWRNIIPYLEPLGRCIAPDLIGMGKSDKPKIEYSYKNHSDYLDKFIEKLNLKNITLVLHDWGSGLGFHYANTHRNNIKAISFMEAMVKPIEPSPEMQTAFKMMRTKGIGWLMISVGNMFINKMLPSMINRKLTEEEFNYYKAPYPTIGSRKALREFPKNVPIGEEPKYSYDRIKAYGDWLTETDLPKLLLYVSPGALIRDVDVSYIKENFSNLKTVDVGKGLHFIQEDHPHRIGEEIAEWYKEL
ncbi:haloalkane dehalogenase [Flammeovirga agarivorans]|uniref:Haloalkane dehalogenase n=1 Tax=Flammeovirga agarivorans TaxID=2726742 RepID=A0A7X8XVM1_9BACT|nr:haloalkane dehalogenase [Flammeovirga agarivorans]NLR91426.1 haloalkane dehalogenase [Flammeovirga agarivorans]